MSYTYPNSNLNYYRVLAATLGSFWGDGYGGLDQVISLMRTWGQGALELENDLYTLQKVSSRLSCPLRRTRRWVPVRFWESDLTYSDILRFGDFAFFGPQPADGYEYRFNTAPVGSRVNFPWDTDIVTTSACCNTPKDPSLFWQYNIDFQINENLVTFPENPFKRNDLDIVVSNNDGEEDRYVTLWFYNNEIESNYVRDHYGYAVGIESTASEQYKKLVNVFWDALTLGTSDIMVNKFLAALYDVPIVTQDGTVSNVSITAGDKWIATDKELIRLYGEDAPTVNAGEVVRAGEFPSIAMEEENPRSGFVSDTLPGIVLPASHFAPEVKGSLGFENDIVDLTWSGDQLRFDIDGNAAVIERFWDEYYARCESKGVDGALLLSQGGRHSRINPYEFLVKNVLRYNYRMFFLKTDLVGPDAMSSSLTSKLRLVIPPNKGIMLFEDTGSGELLQDIFRDTL